MRMKIFSRLASRSGIARLILCFLVLMMLVLVYAWYKHRAYIGNAEKRERYLISLQLVMAEAQNGDVLDDVNGKSASGSLDESIVALYARPYGELGSSVSDFLELRWVKDGHDAYWEIREKNHHNVGLFEIDRLILSEKSGLRWESGRAFFSERARGSN